MPVVWAVQSSGSVIAVQQASLRVSPDSASLLVSPDGASLLVSPDSASLLVSPDSASLLVSPDRDSLLVCPDSVILLVSPDGAGCLGCPVQCVCHCWTTGQFTGQSRLVCLSVIVVSQCHCTGLSRPVYLLLYTSFCLLGSPECLLLYNRPVHLSVQTVPVVWAVQSSVSVVVVKQASLLVSQD